MDNNEIDVIDELTKMAELDNNLEEGFSAFKILSVAVLTKMYREVNSEDDTNAKIDILSKNLAIFLGGVALNLNRITKSEIKRSKKRR